MGLDSQGIVPYNVYIYVTINHDKILLRQVTAERQILELEAERLGYVKCHGALKPWLGDAGISWKHLGNSWELGNMYGNDGRILCLIWKFYV